MLLKRINSEIERALSGAELGIRGKDVTPSYRPG